MNDYEQKRAARIERLRARADAHGAQVDARFATARQIGSAIPFGQPILVGHHSEGRHRRDLARIDANMRKGVEAQKTAEDLERRARAAETSTAVSSDDPDAVAKLRAKVEGLERGCERMKRANAMIRKGATAADLAAFLGWPETTAAKLLAPDFAGRIGFPDYKLTNDRAELRRLRARIELLERRAIAAPPAPVERDGVRIEETDNRVRIFFPSKPDETVRSALKSRGFRWSPSVGAWQRHASPGAWFDAKEVVGKLERR